MSTDASSLSVWQQCMKGFPPDERRRIGAAVDREVVTDQYRARHAHLLRMLDDGAGPDVLLPLIAAACWLSRSLHDEVRPDVVLGLLLNSDTPATPELLDALAQSAGVTGK